MGNLMSRPGANRDIVIVVVGPAGAGKSSLINAAVGRNAVKVGNTLEPCTTTVRSVRCSYRNEVWPGGQQVTFVDTPALQQDECETLDELRKQLGNWMKKARVQEVAGIFYLHKMSDNRITAPSASTMIAFERFCGKDVSSRILLLTTMWEGLDPDIGQSREDEIKTKYWQNMLLSGSHIVRFDKTAESVWAAVDLITENIDSCSL